MFNLYYLNYTKAFEIAMQIDNKVLEKRVKQNQLDGEGNAQGEAGLPELGFLDKVMPKLNGNITLQGAISNKTEDTLKVISTKSTILEPVVQKAVEVRKLGTDRIGKLVKIKDVTLKIANYQDIIGSKILLNGLLKNVPVEGFGNMDVSSIFNIFLKDAAYIVSGQIPEKVSILNNSSSDKLLFKIPMKLDSEMENSYSISDLEIGPVTVIGIYRGTFEYQSIRNKVDVFSQMSGNNQSTDNDLETDDSVDNNQEIKPSDKVHYIDVIAIVQELY